MKILLYGGVTRSVILTRRWAIKIPSLVYGWRMFLYGLLANMQEVAWSGFDERLCPVAWSSWGGWIVVMPRCDHLTDDEYLAEVYDDWPRIIDGITDLPYSRYLPVEMKADSFGRLNGKVVAFDYGGCGRNGRTTMMPPA